jgi:predicted transcriptional regulator
MNMHGSAGRQSKNAEQLAQSSLEHAKDIICAIIKAQGADFQIERLSELLGSVYSKVYRFTSLTCGDSASEVSVGESIHDDYIVCLEDGVRVKMLKKYLKRKFGMSAEDYIRKHKLPLNYPMVAPAYSKQRRELAVKAKLGHMRGNKEARKVA